MNNASHCRLIELACIAEAAAEKPGNVTPTRPFEDLSFADFQKAARLSAPFLVGQHHDDQRAEVGRSIELAVEATVRETGTNVNLGICILLGPLAAVRPDDWPNVESVMQTLSIADTEAAYRAINLAQPGGLGNVPSQDVRNQPTVNLLEAMKLAAPHDGIARLYATEFRDIFDFAVPTLLTELEAVPLADAIIRLAVRWHAKFPDTHIARRAGHEVAEMASGFAKNVTQDWSRLEEFDAWLQSADHKRNPGTTADIVAATLYVALRNDSGLAESAEQWLSERGYW